MKYSDLIQFSTEGYASVELPRDVDLNLKDGVEVSLRGTREGLWVADKLILWGELAHLRSAALRSFVSEEVDVI